MLLDGLESAAGFLGQRKKRGYQQITECLEVGTTYPAAHLVQVA